MRYTPEALIDIHTRCHQSLVKLVDHCVGFTAVELGRELEGFGYPSISRQLHHMIWGEDVWMCVVRGATLIEQRPEEYPTLDDLRVYRETVSGSTMEFLRSATDESLSAPRPVIVGEGRKRELVPAHVILRIVTHYFQHQGQVAAMCRLLGRPIPAGLDFPLA